MKKMKEKKGETAIAKLQDFNSKIKAAKKGGGWLGQAVKFHTDSQKADDFDFRKE